MASITVQKWTTAAACGGQVAHVYRTREHYGNQDIDPAQAAANLFVRDAAESRAAIRETIAAIDSVLPPKRIRADRKTIAELCIPAPRDGMTRDDAVRFLSAAYKEMATACDDMVIVGAAIHGDEVHGYIDPDSKERRESRLHMHVLVVPNVPERGCNMKAWLTRNKYRELNRVLDRVCERELGYSYQDGSGQKSRGDVERMKQRSLQAETDKIRQEVTRLDKVRQETQQEADKAARRAERDNQRAVMAEQARRRSEDAQKRSEDALREQNATIQRQDARIREMSDDIKRLDVLREVSSVPDSAALAQIKQSVKKTLGGRASLAWGDYEALIKMADDQQAARHAVDRMQQDKFTAEDRARTADERAERRVQQQTMEEMRQAGIREARLQRFERMKETFPDAFREMDNRLDRMDRTNRNRNRNKDIGYDR